MKKLACLVEPNDIAGLSRAIIKVLTDTSLHAKLKEGVIKWASNFSWEKSSKNFMEVLKKVYTFHFKQNRKIK